MSKILQILLTLWGVASVIFLLFNVLPDDPARMMLDQNENQQQLQAIKRKYGFDKPLLTQYAYYLNDLSVMSFHSQNPKDYTFFSEEKYTGFSFFSTEEIKIVLKLPYLRESFQKNGKKVSEIIIQTLPNTLLLAVSAISIAIVVGGLFGIISALRKDTWVDSIVQIISVLGMGLPSFFSAILLAWIMGFLLSNYTGLSMTGNLYEIDDYTGAWQLQWRNLVLPSVALGIRPLAVVTQLMRNSLLEVFSQEYIRTAYAKGLTHWQVVFRHALKNALPPVITALSGWFAGMLAGAVFVEHIFGWNGLGKEMVAALNTLDLPVVMGGVLVISVIFVLINFVVDVLYKWLDPRVK